jgi:hypothetical protein
MSQIKVLAGDFAKRDDSFFHHITGMGSFSLYSYENKAGKSEKISITQVESIEVVSEDKKRITFKCFFSDGKQLMAETDKKTYTSIQAALMDAPRQLEIEQKFQEKLAAKAAQNPPKEPRSTVDTIKLLAMMPPVFLAMVSLSASFGAVICFSLSALTMSKRVTTPLIKRFNLPTFSIPLAYTAFFLIGFPFLTNSGPVQENLNHSESVAVAPVEEPPQTEPAAPAATVAPIKTPKPEPTPTTDPDVVAAGSPPQIDTLFGGYPQVKNYIKKELGSEPEYVRWFNPILERSCSDGRACWRVKTVIRKNGQEGGFYAFMRYGKIIDTKFESY